MILFNGIFCIKIKSLEMMKNIQIGGLGFEDEIFIFHCFSGIPNQQ